MKKYKVINKQPDKNLFIIQKIKYSIQGKILFITSSENNNIYIITDFNLFYVIEKGMPNKTKKYKISPLNKKNLNYQTEEKESQIWCDKLGNHIIFKYQNNLYYFNPQKSKEKLSELNLFYNNFYLQPYAVAFNNDFYDTCDTGDILFSDFNSDIYKLRIQLNDKNKVKSFFFKIFSFKKSNKINIIDIKNYEDEEEDEEEYFSDLDFFQFEKNERILDMKIIFSCENKDIYDAKFDNNGRKILILANTKNKIFQFYGKDSFEKVFGNYSLENGDILRAYKLFHNKKNFNLKKSRIQLFNQYVPFYKFETFKKPELLFSCMFQSGYCIGRFEDLLNPIPIKEFIMYDYPLPQIQKSFPIMVCQSLIHIYYLYEDCLIIKNKLTNRIASKINLSEKYLDIFFNFVMNEIILYSSNNIYKISLDLESKYLWEYYVEIGNYKSALENLTKEDKYMKPILHKLYANLLFEQKNYFEAAVQYAFSDENFEHVCLKFLRVGCIEALLKYFALVFNIIINQNKNKKNKNKKRISNAHIAKKDKLFIEKYLINTWIFEILIIKKEFSKKEEIIPFIRDYTRNCIHGENYIDKNIIYFELNYHGKFEELIEYAKLNQDYEYALFNLINFGKTIEALEFIKICFDFGIEYAIFIMKKMFYKYGIVFMRQNPEETINLLDNNFNIYDNPKGIMRILLSFNFNKNNLKEKNLKILIKYIKKIVLNELKLNKDEENKTDYNNMYNLLILFLCLITNKNNKNELINVLKNLIDIKQKNIYFNLNFAKNIFKNNIPALSLIYLICSEYNKFVEISFDNKLQDILKFVLMNIGNKNIKIRLIHLILKYKQRRNNIEFKYNGYKKDKKGKIEIIDNFVLKITDKLKINIFNDEQLNSIINELFP